MKALRSVRTPGNTTANRSTTFQLRTPLRESQTVSLSLSLTHTHTHTHTQAVTTVLATCYVSRNWSPVSHCGHLGSIPGQSIRDILQVLQISPARTIHQCHTFIKLSSRQHRQKNAMRYKAPNDCAPFGLQTSRQQSLATGVKLWGPRVVNPNKLLDTVCGATNPFCTIQSD